MHRRTLITSGLGAATTTLLWTPDAETRPVESEAHRKQQGVLADIYSGHYVCTLPDPYPPETIDRHSYQMFIFARTDRLTALRDASGEIGLALPYFDPEDYRFHKRTSHGFNFEGFRPRRARRFGVRVPCQARYRDDVTINAFVYYQDWGTGREMEFKANGSPGGWLWLKHVRTRHGRNSCPFIISEI